MADNKEPTIHILENFRRNVIIRREQLKLSQAGVAEKMGIKQPNYAKIENGYNVPTLVTLAKVAEALDTTPILLLMKNAFSQ